jgi:hypothetical protein
MSSNFTSHILKKSVPDTIRRFIGSQDIVLLLLAFLLIACKKHPEDLIPDPGSGPKYTEILGRLTNSSVTLSILFDQKAEVYLEYGNATGLYKSKSSTVVAEKDTPLEINISNLTTDTKYYYRTRYRLFETTTSFFIGNEHSFHTQRPVSSTFTFAVEADPHLDANSDTAAFSLTLNNILLKKPDFILDLGDTFFSEKQPNVNQTVVTDRHILYRPFFGSVCHSVPLYLTLGNHEGESGWRSNGTSGSLPVMASVTRKLYYPNPVPDSFFSGNNKSENLVGLRQNYYSWEWGSALFMVIDPYWYTLANSDWGWTLGTDQYNWFKNVITSSKAKYKFVFCHQLVGGNGKDARGGAEFAHLFEMGGSNPDGTWGFDTNRPGWGKPLHTLMKENNATIFFHGHDHFYGKQDKDGIVYQEVPQPSNKNIANFSASQYGYTSGLLLPGRGYLLVTVSGTSVKVDYNGTYLPSEENASRKNGDIITSYIIN